MHIGMISYASSSSIQPTDSKLSKALVWPCAALLLPSKLRVAAESLAFSSSSSGFCTASVPLYYLDMCLPHGSGHDISFLLKHEKKTCWSSLADAGYLLKNTATLNKPLHMVQRQIALIEFNWFGYQQVTDRGKGDTTRKSDLL